MKIEEFMQSLTVQTRSAETLRAYRQTLARFNDFLRARHLRITQVTRSTIAEFVAHLESSRGRTHGEHLAPATIVRQLAILSSYFEFLSDSSGGKIRNPVRHVKRPKVANDLPRAVDDQVLSSLLEGITDLRDKAMILTFLYSGLRLSELSQLNKDSIVARKHRSSEGSFEVYGHGEVVGKGDKRRDFLVGPKVLDALGAYIRACRRHDDNPALFLSSRKERISNRAVQQVLDKWCKRLALPHIHVHQLRHSFATRNANAGMPPEVLQSLLGHNNPQTTGRYFRLCPERKTREYFAAMEYIKDTSPV